MTTDPFDVLVAAARQDWSWEQPVDLDTDTRAAAILHRVMTGTVVVPLERGRRRRRHVAIGALAVGALAAGSAVAVAAANWTRRTPSTVRALACWNHAPLGDDGVIIGVRFVRGEDPTVTCARSWEQPEHAEFGVTPPFVTCVADYGTAVVIPGADETACDAAGLDRFDGRIAPDIWEVAAAEDEMAALDEAGACMDLATATTTVRATLDRHGLGTWTVSPAPGADFAGETCAMFGFDEATSSVTIAARPKDMG
ncbi:MAG: hypothetical protein QM733_06015 [Ilumatobacteraceae bacterium]